MPFRGIIFIAIVLLMVVVFWYKEIYNWIDKNFIETKENKKDE
jgi:hypothetical protein